jgi:Cof subfamily protein (haloacid dehalogenase superfamily)
LPFRLLALDVDGTLLDPTGSVRPRVAQAVHAALATGCRVVLATGRRIQSAAPIARRFGISLLILTDGTLIYDLAEQAVLYEEPLAPELLAPAVALSLEVGLSPLLFESPRTEARILVGPSVLDNPETADYLGHRPEVTRLPVSELARARDILSVICLGNPDLVQRLAVLARAVADYSLIVWQPSTSGYHHHTLSIAAPGSSKGQALSWLAERWGVPRHEVMAIGDHYNDVSLMTAAGWGVAMGNAVPPVLAAADEVVADNENDGVAEAIERWILV